MKTIRLRVFKNVGYASLRKYLLAVLTYYTKKLVKVYKEYTPYSTYATLGITLMFIGFNIIKVETNKKIYGAAAMHDSDFEMAYEKAKEEQTEPTVNPNLFLIDSLDVTRFYGKNLSDFTEYWFNSTAHKRYTEKYPNTPFIFMMANMWAETAGGYTGVGRRGNLHGIKNLTKSGKSLKGYDKVEAKGGVNDGKVNYEAYNWRWESISSFYILMQKKFYQRRIKRWSKELRQYPIWVHYALGMQVDTYIRDTPSYATEGIPKIVDAKTYWGRLEKSFKVLRTCVEIHNKTSEVHLDWITFKEQLVNDIKKVNAKKVSL